MFIDIDMGNAIAGEGGIGGKPERDGDDGSNEVLVTVIAETDPVADVDAGLGVNSANSRS